MTVDGRSCSASVSAGTECLLYERQCTRADRAVILIVALPVSPDRSLRERADVPLEEAYSPTVAAHRAGVVMAGDVYNAALLDFAIGSCCDEASAQRVPARSCHVQPAGRAPLR